LGWMPTVATSAACRAANSTQARLDGAVVATVTTRRTPAAAARPRTSGRSAWNFSSSRWAWGSMSSGSMTGNPASRGRQPREDTILRGLTPPARLLDGRGSRRSHRPDDDDGGVVGGAAQVDQVDEPPGRLLGGAGRLAQHHHLQVLVGDV